MVAPNTDRSRTEQVEEARKVARISAETGIADLICHVMIPGMIDEDDDRPVEMKPKLDVLDYWQLIAPELRGVKGLCTQVTAFSGEAALRRRLTDLVAAGMEGIAFVGVPRTMSDGDGDGVAPIDALTIYRDLVPNRGAILIPTRATEVERFGVKCRAGATYGMTQLLYSDAIVGFLKDFARISGERPEILLSFGFVPAVESRVGADQLAHRGSRQRRRRGRAGVRQSARRRRARAPAPAHRRPLSAGDRWRRRPRLSTEYSFRVHLRVLRAGLRHLRRNARLLVPARAVKGNR